jgi:ribonuclease HII
MVYGIAFCPKAAHTDIKGFGFAGISVAYHCLRVILTPDSKTLTDPQREVLFERIKVGHVSSVHALTQQHAERASEDRVGRAPALAGRHLVGDARAVCVDDVG